MQVRVHEINSFEGSLWTKWEPSELLILFSLSCIVGSQVDLINILFCSADQTFHTSHHKIGFGFIWRLPEAPKVRQKIGKKSEWPCLDPSEEPGFCLRRDLTTFSKYVSAEFSKTIFRFTRSDQGATWEPSECWDFATHQHHHVVSGDNGPYVLSERNAKPFGDIKNVCTSNESKDE